MGWIDFGDSGFPGDPDAELLGFHFVKGTLSDVEILADELDFLFGGGENAES